MERRIKVGLRQGRRKDEQKGGQGSARLVSVATFCKLTKIHKQVSSLRDHQ